jgi:hypothetical protein
MATYRVSLERELRIVYREQCTINTKRPRGRRRRHSWDKLTIEEQEFAKEFYTLLTKRSPYRKRVANAIELVQSSAGDLSQKTRAYVEKLESALALYLSSTNRPQYKRLAKRVVKHVHSLDDLTESALRSRIKELEKEQASHSRELRKKDSRYNRLNRLYVRARQLYIEEQEKVDEIKADRRRNYVKKSTCERAKARAVRGLQQALDYQLGEYDTLEQKYLSAEAAARRVPGLEAERDAARADVASRDRSIADLTTSRTSDTAHIREAAYHLVEQGEYEAGIRMYRRIVDRFAGEEQGKIMKSIAAAFYRWGVYSNDKTKIATSRDTYLQAQGLLPGDRQVRDGLDICQAALV